MKPDNAIAYSPGVPLPRRAFLGMGIAAFVGAAVPLRRVWAGADEEPLPPLRIAFFTDVHAMAEKGAPEKMAATAARLAAEPADLVVGGGDFVHGGFGSTPERMAERLGLFRDFIKQVGRPFRPMIGNHDLVGAQPEDGSPPAADPRATILELLGLQRSHYAFDAGAYRFFVLDPTQIVGGEIRYRGWVDDAQIAWLREELRGNPRDQPLVLCSHIPFRTTFIQDRESPTAALPENLVVGNANEILTLFSGHRLVMVLQGHLHTDEQIRWNGREFVQGGAVSGAWWNGPNRGTDPGYGVIELGPSPVGWRYPC